ncbi:MAG: hypothetical protein KDA45_16300, partial [Planctomycetales bacterium]|nr:hypothetical protein [Planctomycetales bacterium]
TLVHDGFELVVNSVEQIAYDSGGGPDRVYLYDSDGDDTLTARPRSAELVGVGYRFEVTEVSRIYVHATGGGQDYAYLYDSQGDDRLSVRPQFSSLSGDGYFNYVRGFERVYAYATGGGQDRADLYDSSGDDRFATSGASASVVGPGFSSFTRSFESVYAHSSGGSDLATLYGASAQTQWQQGSDFIRFREGDLSREARGFQSVETFVAGQPQRLGESLASLGEGQAPLLSTANTSPWLTPVGWASQDVERPLAEEPAVAQPLHGPAAHPNLAELGVLRQTDELSAWLQTRLALPEEPLLNDPLLEHSLLDEIFGQL